MPKPNRDLQKLQPDDFVKNETVQACFDKLGEKFNDNNPLVVSDVLDAEGNQYVNLVQKGGGVLGIALVGYTYVLEKMGIRFLKLAGTSAGAINTSLMAVVTAEKDKTKSDKILQYITGLDFFKLVDGHPAMRRLIRNFITNKNFTVQLKQRVLALLITFIACMACAVIFQGIQTKIPKLEYLTKTFFILTGFLLLIIVVFANYVGTMLKRLKNSGFGINPGDYFYDWIKERLLENGVQTVSDLYNKVRSTVPQLHLRGEHPAKLSELDGDVTFIASELVTENKILFPRMCDLFRREDEIDSLQPAGFVRASMAIPFFFESYFITDIPCNDKKIMETWKERLNEPDPPETARFVDGGILSNFPIDVYYNPNIFVPRLPVFGIDLDDSEPQDKTKHAAAWSLPGYIMRIFNSARFNYDKEFLLKNKMFARGIGKVHLSGYNWINFFLTDKQKINLFVAGAEAATDFLLHFNWEEYKKDRSLYHEQLQQEQKAMTTAKISNT